jgi:hypothetical protein
MDAISLLARMHGTAEKAPQAYTQCLLALGMEENNARDVG